MSTAIRTLSADWSSVLRMVAPAATITPQRSDDAVEARREKFAGAPLVVLAAGGTGGHLFPAEALAHELVERGARVALLTDARGEKMGQNNGLETHRVPAAAMLGRGIPQRVASTAVIAWGTLRAALILRRLKPRVIVGFGGYPSVPTLLAAAQAGLPIVLHEQNSVLGRANRLVARFATSIATSFDDTRAVRAADSAKLARTGNPVRPAIGSLAERRYNPPVEDGPVNLLVTGGSQGARILGEIVPDAINALPTELRGRLRIAQQVRAEDIDRVRTAYEEAGVEAEIDSFFTDVPRRLAGAHIAICRSGASTIAELTVAGVPSILVPLPSSADDHQMVNARALEQAGGAWVMPQPEFTPAALARQLFSLIRDRDRLAAASTAARSMAIVDAEQRLADLVRQVGGLA